MKYLLTTLLALTFFGVNAQKAIDVSSFSEISLKTSATVYITQGNKHHVEISGDDDAMEEADIYVRGSKLIIDSDDDWSWFGNSDGDLVVKVTTPNINGLSVSGSGKLYAENTFRTNELDLSVSGSGKMELEADAKSTTASVSGSGRIFIKGSTESMRVSISGSGKIRGEDFKSKSCRATISGSGSCEIYVENEIEAHISGSGSVYYAGNPDKVNSRTSGSGRVKKM